MSPLPRRPLLELLDESVEVAEVDLDAAGQTHGGQAPAPNQAAKRADRKAEHRGGLGDRNETRSRRRQCVSLGDAIVCVACHRRHPQKPPRSISPPQLTAFVTYQAAPRSGS